VERKDGDGELGFDVKVKLRSKCRLPRLRDLSALRRGVVRAQPCGCLVRSLSFSSNPTLFFAALNMNTLVDYGSSSENEDTQEQTMSTRTKASETATVNGEKVEKPSGPLVGPLIPTDGDVQDGGYASFEQLPDDMCEQDLLRHITQASHPMTTLPSSPPGSPDAQAEAKFKRFLELKKKGVHFNQDLANKSSFRNPALFTTLMDRAGLERDDQYASALPISIWDPASLPTFAYKEESTSGKRVIDFAAATTSKSGGSSQTSTTRAR
jgi:hypothetical protein